MDGDSIVMLQKAGTIEQLSICGFNTIKKQMKFKKAVMLLECDSSSTPSAADSGFTVNANYEKFKISSKCHKLTKTELNQLPAEEKRLYLRM